MIHHLTREIPPSALDACIEFYGLLGFRPVPVAPGISGRARWLEAEGPVPTQIHLMPSDEVTPPAPGHVAVVCREYAATVAALEAAGYPVDPRREHWGAPRSYVRDPAGHLVELMKRTPGEAKGGAASG